MKTAVQWLMEQLYNNEKLSMSGDGNILDELLEQAKEMEKEQMIKAWKSGDGQHDKVADKLAEQWYEKTYGGNK